MDRYTNEILLEKMKIYSISTLEICGHEYFLCHFNLENVQESILSDCSKLIF